VQNEGSFYDVSEDEAAGFQEEEQKSEAMYFNDEIENSKTLDEFVME
jgi:hypothetical protein